MIFIGQGCRHVDRLLRATDTAVWFSRGWLIFYGEPDLHRGDLHAWIFPSGRRKERSSSRFTATEIALLA